MSITINFVKFVILSLRVKKIYIGIIRMGNYTEQKTDFMLLFLGTFSMPRCTHTSSL